MADRGRDTGYALTEIRTVLSRAETARRTVENITHDDWYARRYGVDPDTDDMLAALDKCVELLSRWRRTGKSKT